MSPRDVFVPVSCSAKSARTTRDTKPGRSRSRARRCPRTAPSSCRLPLWPCGTTASKLFCAASRRDVAPLRVGDAAAPPTPSTRYRRVRRRSSTTRTAASFADDGFASFRPTPARRPSPRAPVSVALGRPPRGRPGSRLGRKPVHRADRLAPRARGGPAQRPRARAAATSGQCRAVDGRDAARRRPRRRPGTRSSARRECRPRRTGRHGVARRRPPPRPRPGPSSERPRARRLVCASRALGRRDKKMGTAWDRG